MVPPPREQVDGSVQAFQPLDAQNVLVLGIDGNLWLESSPFAVSAPPGRAQVDGDVQAFQGLDTQTVFVLGTDGNLWLESSPFGVSIPPTTRKQVDGSVRAFQALDTRTVLVLGTDGNLWLESSPFGVKVPPDNRTQVDASVQAFQALETQTVLVLKNRRYPLARVQSVWHEHPSDEPHAGRWQRSSLPRPRQSDDPGAREGSHLWLEFGPFGLNVPPTRELIDVACKPSRRSIV